MRYRADIDGLRAIAVLAVVFYHADVPGFAGGFVGVDIFFVISGYLICGMIDADLRRGSFSLIEFYKRRILRILPALLVMIAVTSLLAYNYLLPVELEEYAKSLASAIGSMSNVYFAKTAGYFEPPAEAKPLLHTWSLGVEEQFYFVVPLLMMLGYRLAPRWTKALFALGAAVSFAAAIVMSYRNDAFLFYLSPFRAWKLALGALLSIGLLPVPHRAAGRSVCGLAGAALLLGIICFGSASVPLLAMTGLASVGAVLVIASSEREASAVGRLLSLRPIVFIGLISYSLYLWHWPLIVFQRSEGLFAPGSANVVSPVLIAMSIALGYLSWRYVELPFRALAGKTSQKAVFGSAAAAAASALAACGVVLLVNGVPSRFPERVVALGSYLAYDPSEQFRTGRCFIATNRQQLDRETCLKADPARPNYLLVGDSHAAHLWYGLASAMPHVNVMQATVSMCRPLLGSISLLDSRACPRVMRFVFDEFLAIQRVDRVLLAASWKDEDLDELVSTLETLKRRGVDVTVLGPIVEYDRPLPRLLADEILRGNPEIASRMRSEGIRERDIRMRQLAAQHGAGYLSVYEAVCAGGTCDEVVEGDTPMQFDAGHLTAKGSVAVARRLAPAFAGKVATADAASD